MTVIALHELIARVLNEECGVGKSRARTLASYFGNLNEFINCTPEKLAGLKTVGGRNVSFSMEEIGYICSATGKGMLDPGESVESNYISVISKSFTTRQVKNIKQLQLGDLSPNPILAMALNMKDPLEMLEFNVYSAVSRSIVTSMGYFVQDLLLSTSEDVEKVSSGWDIVKKGHDGIPHWIQVKSGPNDMDKDQIIYWLGQIKTVEERGERGYIGITYGRRESSTVTLSLMKTYLPDMDFRTLIGRELWDFLSGDRDFHERLLNSLRFSAKKVLDSRTIGDEIKDCISRLHKDFVKIYGNGEEGLANYIRDII